MPSGLVRMFPLSPDATKPPGQAVTHERKREMGVVRGVQVVPFGLVKIFRLWPLTTERVREAHTPCRSLVVKRGSRTFQSTPRELTTLVTRTFVPMTLVCET